jgi:hypothetical protein
MAKTAEKPDFQQVAIEKLYELFRIPYKPSIYAVMGEFEDGPQLVEAGRKVREAGYTKLDAMTPFPVHGIDDALGIPRSILGYICFGVALFGTANAVGLMWYTGAYTGEQLPFTHLLGLGSYPLIIGGKPLFDVAFGLPIMFELSVLFAAFAAFFGMFALNGLPRMHHPSMNYSRSHKATDDGFILIVEATDPKFAAADTKALLESLGAKNVEIVEDQQA